MEIGVFIPSGNGGRINRTVLESLTQPRTSLLGFGDAADSFSGRTPRLQDFEGAHGQEDFGKTGHTCKHP